MFNSITRSSRGLLIMGAVLAIAAFALVVVLFNQKSKNAATPAVPTATAATIGPSGQVVMPSATVPIAQQGLGEVAAIRDVPPGTRLSDSATIALYFKDQPAIGAIPQDAVQSTSVLTTSLVSNTVHILNKVPRGTILTASNYELLPFSPPTSLSYSIRPGRVGETIQLPALSAVNGVLVPGDFVNVLLTIHYRELSEYSSNPPLSGNAGPEQTQQLIPDVRVIDVKPAAPYFNYTLELSQQDALVLKYVKDTGGTIDLALMSSTDVKTQAAQPRTNAVVPQFLLTPVTILQGTPQRNGLIDPFATPLPTLTPNRATPVR